LTLLAAGTVTLQTDQAGNENYNPAPPVVQSLQVLKAPQSIDFAPLDSKTYLDAPFTLSATSSSSLPVAFQVLSGSATISNGTLSIIGAGTVTVRASQSGGSNFLPAAPVEQSFFVSRANQTLAFGTLSAKTFRDAPFSLTASASSSLPVDFQVLSGSATVSNGTLSIIGAGMVTVRATQVGNSNFSPAASVDQSFLVSRANQTLTFSSLSAKTFLDAPFSLTASAASGLPVTFTVLDGPGTLNSGILTILGAGTVTVRASQAGDLNYAAALSVDRSFTVFKAPATVVIGGTLDVAYDGVGHGATVSTNPPGLGVDVTYALAGGSASGALPVRAGGYLVTATINDANYQGAASASLTIGKEIAPTILQQPVGATVSSGTIILATVAAGSPTLQYQWFRNGTSLSGATGASVNLGSMSAELAGSYTVRVSNTVGTVTSDAAVLVYASAPVIATQPLSVLAKIGDDVTLSVNGSSVPAPTYQWKKDGKEIPGATGSTLPLGKVSAAGVASYSVVLTNQVGALESGTASVTVREWIEILTQPKALTYTNGSPLSIPVEVSGAKTDIATYQWFKDGVAQAGATSSTLTLAGTASDAGSYVLKASSGTFTVTSTASQVLVGKPVVSFDQTSIGSVVGSALNLSVGVVSDAKPLGYQWRYNGVNLAGETSGTLSMISAGPLSNA
ncbi:MAG: immunoglobulin domain-containing protein, partial [Verrucomicrobiota bacterium]